MLFDFCRVLCYTLFLIIATYTRIFSKCSPSRTESTFSIIRGNVDRNGIPTYSRPYFLRTYDENVGHVFNVTILIRHATSVTYSVTTSVTYKVWSIFEGILLCRKEVKEQK